MLEVSDLVLRRTQSTKEKHKLSPPWEGPYMVTKVIRPGTYRLKDDNATFSPTHGTSNNYVISSPKARSYRILSIQRLLLQHPSPSTLALGRSWAPRGCDTTPLFYYHIVVLFTQTKG